MSKQDRQKAINANVRLLKQIRSGTDVNKVRFSAANSDSHEIGKARIALQLLRQGHDFITEAEFRDGGRADVFDLVTGEVWEVLTSETEEECKEKIKKYPVPPDMIHFVKMVKK